MRTNRLLKMAAACGLFLATAMQFGCGGGYIKPKSSESDSDASDTEQGQVTASVDADGIASATIAAGATTTQLIAPPAGSTLAGAAVSLPPGALQIDVNLAIQEGESLATYAASLPAGSSDPLTAAGPTIVFSPSSAVETTVPMTLSLPLAATASLVQGTETLAVAFVATAVKNGSTSNIWGLIPPASLTIQAQSVSFATTRFGAFQVVRTPKRLEAPVEAAILTPPPLKPTTTAPHLGLWQSACVEQIEYPDATQPTYQYKFWTVTNALFGRDIMEVREGHFSDENCKNQLLSSSIRARYTIASDNPAHQGGKNVDFVIELVQLTLLKQESVDGFNKEQGCGFSDWAINTPRDISGRSCKKNDTANKHVTPAAGSKIYSLFAVANGVLRLGKDDSTTAETRGNELEAESKALRRR